VLICFGYRRAIPKACHEYIAALSRSHNFFGGNASSDQAARWIEFKSLTEDPIGAAIREGAPHTFPMPLVGYRLLSHDAISSE
jgi:hypothetical protein